MKCRDFHEIIDSYLSDELLTETNHSVLHHLEQCADCRHEIEARREVRSRVRSAVLRAPGYRIDPDYAVRLDAALKSTPIAESEQTERFSLVRNSWVLVAASLVIAFGVGFLMFNPFGSGSPEKAGNTPSISNISSNNIVNVALGDHEHCAIRRNLKELPISLDQASVEYRGLDKVVVPPLKRVLANYELVEAHACKYKDTRFAHIVLKDHEQTLSVLMTDLNASDEETVKDLVSFTSVGPKYQIARFDTRNHAIFVVSNLDEVKNAEATRALFAPLRKHFGETSDIQTALLAFY